VGGPTALPLGLMAGATFPAHPAHPVHLESGDRLLLTDGVSEAHRPGQQAFGDERISAVLLDTVELLGQRGVQLGVRTDAL
jgi:serine phosphatase RsbU (regulator of sigma subunit)